MVKDISNQTVFVLAILAIVISTLSVATIYYETSALEFRSGVEGNDSGSGSISVSIKEEPEPATTEGQISLGIVDNESVEG